MNGLASSMKVSEIVCWGSFRRASTKKIRHKGKAYVVNNGRIEFADVFGEGQTAWITLQSGNRVMLTWDDRDKEMTFDQALRQLDLDGFEPVGR